MFQLRKQDNTKKMKWSDYRNIVTATCDMPHPPFEISFFIITFLFWNIESLLIFELNYKHILNDLNFYCNLTKLKLFKK